MNEWRTLTRTQIAERVAADIPDGSYVNLGIGLPTEVSDVAQGDKEVVFHSENGVLGVGPKPLPDRPVPDLINAGKEPVTLVTGGAYMSHADSFGLIRGRHLDLAILGAYQVSTNGDLANWTRDDAIPGVGGAMDLAIGARSIWVMMTVFTAGGRPKLVPECSYPLTARGVVKRVYTDVGTFHLDGSSISVTGLADGATLEELGRRLDLDLAGRTEVGRKECR